MLLPELERIFSCVYEDFIIFCLDVNEPIRACSCTRTFPSSLRIFVKEPVITTLSFSTENRLKDLCNTLLEVKRVPIWNYAILYVTYDMYMIVANLLLEWTCSLIH